MTEIIQLRKEQMLPELEQMRAIELVDKPEIDQIKKKRERFEYKLQRRSRSIDDYLSYITYEKTLLLFIQERRKSRKIHGKKGIDERISTKIYHLYSIALERFPEDIATWDNFVKYCVTSGQSNRISSIWDKYIKFHGDKAEVWIKAGLWEWKEAKNIPKAISFLSRGIQRHPKCSELYVLFIKTELSNCEHEGERIKLVDGDVKADTNFEEMQALAVKRTQVIFRQLVDEGLDTEEILQELIEFVEKYSFADGLLEMIQSKVEINDDSS